ncbi:DnaJ domain-containing protein [Nocardioides panacis]|uniref:DnaJ domain-containing protein n=1 Tax=Nocardioides panacis TaxID=2849501 RepID=UPI003F572CDC
MARDSYEVLGVSRDADQSEIQRAYRKRARTLHPDVNKDPGAEEEFKELAEAYDVLSDPDQRKRYDAFGEDFRRVGPDVDPEAYRRARAYAGADAGGGRSSGWGGAGPSGDFRYSGSVGDVDLEDLLGGIFGARGRGRGGWGPVSGSDHESEVEVTVEEAYNGTRRTLSMSGADGPRTIDVNVPAGVVDGQRIRLRGQGGQGSGGGEAGDLYLVVRIAPHPRYRLEGRDLHVLLPLAPLGGRARCVGGHRHPRRPRHRRRPGRHLQPSPAAAEGPRAAEQAGQAGGPVRRGPGQAAQVAVGGRTRAVRAAREGLDLRPEERTMTATTTGSPTGSSIGTRWPLARPYRLSLDSYARITGVHPELVRRLVTLGLLDITRDAQGNLWFDPAQVREMATIQRLHLRLNLSYSSLGLVMHLLERISDLERSQRRSRPERGVRWT